MSAHSNLSNNTVSCHLGTLVTLTASTVHGRKVERNGSVDIWGYVWDTTGLQNFQDTSYYNQGQKSLDHLSFISSIRQFRALVRWNRYLKPLSQKMLFPLTTPCFNVALNSGVCASTMWINTENGERGKSLINPPEWSNTFGPDYTINFMHTLHLGRHPTLKGQFTQSEYNTDSDASKTQDQ